MTVRQAIRAGEADQLCQEIARRLDDPGTVQIVEVAHDAPEWFAGHEEPLERTVRAACPSGVTP